MALRGAVVPPGRQPPTCDGAARPRRSTWLAAGSPRGDAEVVDRPIALIVDDAPPVRALLAAVMEREGLACALAESRDAALAALAEHGQRIVLAVVDVHLGEGSDGLGLAAAVHAMLPSVPIAVVCGDGTGLREAAAIPGVVRTLHKSGNLEELRVLARLASHRAVEGAS